MIHNSGDGSQWPEVQRMLRDAPDLFLVSQQMAQFLFSFSNCIVEWGVKGTEPYFGVWFPQFIFLEYGILTLSQLFTKLGLEAQVCLNSQERCQALYANIWTTPCVKNYFSTVINH